MPDSRRVTLSDVAELAGVSATTASYILNGRSDEMRIAVATQERVRRAAVDLNYRPNPSARNLRTARTQTVGMITDLVAGGPFASQMITGASVSARSQDHVILIGESQGDVELEGLLITEMLDRRVDGIVYAKVVTTEIDVPEVLRTHRAVLLNCVDRSAVLPAVLPDEFEGGRSAAAALLEGGIRGGIHVVGERPLGGAIAGPLRFDGIRAALRAAGSDVASEIPCGWSVPEGFKAVTAFLDAGTVPQALITMNDRVAMGTYQALADRGLRVPADVSVVSFDGSDLAQWLRPRLTSIVLPYAELGARAIDLLLGDDRDTGVTRVPMPVAAGRSVRKLTTEPRS
ncbi:LacI family DNA-binding transcriptional regulator [Nocardioides dilutus]